MKILVTGDRNWYDVELVRKVLSEYKDENPIIIHGAARGLDTIAGIVAEQLGYSVLKYPADWERFGRAAGPIRNQEMLKTNPDLVIAFHNNIFASKGTKDMVLRSLQAGKQVRYVKQEGR